MIVSELLDYLEVKYHIRKITNPIFYKVIVEKQKKDNKNLEDYLCQTKQEHIKNVVEKSEERK